MPVSVLGELTGTVAHELRNPLGAIASSWHFLRRKLAADQGADVAKAFDLVDRGIKRCDTIVTELLDFARAKGLQPVPTALDAWLSALLKEQPLPAGIKLRCSLKTKDMSLCFDPEALRRAVINVLDNACQAMLENSNDNGDDDNRLLTVKTSIGAGRAKIVITDTGLGISKNNLLKVLQPLVETSNGCLQKLPERIDNPQ